MRPLSTRTRLAIAVVLAVVVGGVASGVVLARGNGNGNGALVARILTVQILAAV